MPMAFSSSTSSVDPVTGSPIGVEFTGTPAEDFFVWANAYNGLSQLPLSVGVYGQEGNDDFGVVPHKYEPLFGVELFGGLGDDVFLIAGQKKSRVKKGGARRGNSVVYTVREKVGEGNDFLSLRNLDKNFSATAIPDSPAYDGLDVVRVFSPVHNMAVFVTEGVESIRIGDLSGRSTDVTFDQLFYAASTYG